jgi:DUF4097 and DUF4098 domain-containing protein YvlB
LVLIAVGALFLINNLNPDISFWRILGEYWPYLLILWGTLRLAEIAWLASRNQPLPRRGISGNEWGVIVFVTLIGSGMWFTSDLKDRIRTGRVNMRGLQIFGETYEYPVNARMACPKAPRVIIDNRRGNVRLVGTDTLEVSVSGHKKVFGMDRVEADKINERIPLEVSVNGDQVVIRTNQEKAGSDNRVEGELEVKVPAGATVECRGVYGDFDVTGIAGNFEVASDNAGVRGQDIGGNVRVDVRRSDVVRLVRVKGGVDVKGARAEDLELSEITGPVTVDGQFTGEIDFRRIEKTLRFTSKTTDLNLDRLMGRAHFSDGDLEMDDVLGPVRLRSRNKDVRISNYASSIDIQLDRGDIELKPGKAAMGEQTATTSSGGITFDIPDNAKFTLTAETRRGEANNSYGKPLDLVSNDRGATITGGNGGPKVRLLTERGSLNIQRGSIFTSGVAPPPDPPRPIDPPKTPAAPGVVER